MNRLFYQPARQNFGSSQNMQQPTQQNFGGDQGFGGGFGGFQPQGFGWFGGYGGGFNPFQGGFGGGFGFNPMFGGIGGLGFNPMMGPQFGMPMQGFGGFNPYQQQFQPQQDVAFRQDQMLRAGEPKHLLGEVAQSAQSQQNPYLTQQQELETQMRALPEYQALENANKAFQGSEAFKSIQQKQQDLQRQIQQRQPMYGGIGGLGFNPMMGLQFGMPMRGYGLDHQ